MDFLTMSTEDRAKHFAGLSNEDLATAYAALSDTLSKTFAAAKTTPPTIEEVTATEVVAASRKQIAAVQAERAASAKAAAKTFADLESEFDADAEGEGEESDEDAEEDEDTEEGDESDEDEEDEEAEVEAAGKPFEKGDDGDEDEDTESDDEKKREAMTAATRIPARRKSAAKAVAKGTKRPAAKQSAPVTLTAAADVEGFSTGQRLTGMGEVAQTALARVKGFPKWNKSAAEAVNRESGGEPVLRKFGATRITGMHAGTTLTASSGPGQEYNEVKGALRKHTANLKASMDVEKYRGDKEALTAAGFCAPSQVSYDYLTDYAVWGMFSYPEVPAPRGGLMTTTGPALAQTYAPDGSDFGWVLTEAQMEAGVLKTCETIVCPDFEDHRLDAVGYCWKIPILTEKGYPELVEDAMKLSTVLWSHKMNALNINDALALSTSVVASGLGGSFDDTLEALCVLANKERRKYNLGDTAIMEVKMPSWVIEVFRAELSRRPFRASNAPVSNQQIMAEFSARYLAVEWGTDWAELTGANPVFPATFPVQVYPAGTFVTSVEDVINLSAIYDAASLVKNEYTGVFYEQARMLYKAGYGATKFTIPICTAGLVGAPILDCHPESANWSGQKQAVVA